MFHYLLIVCNQTRAEHRIETKRSTRKKGGMERETKKLASRDTFRLPSIFSEMLKNLTSVTLREEGA